MSGAIETAINATFYWLTVASAASIAASTSVLISLGMFQRTHRFAGAGLLIASYVFGLTLWAGGAAATFAYWGWVALLIGLILLGVGVVPMGFLALALHGEWGSFFWLAGFALVTFGARWMGVYCLSDRWNG
jgi:hypothetical protein